jgi:hypothetical protein
MALVSVLHSLHPMPLLATSAAFAVIFGIFVVALLALIVIVITWAIRRDREGRAAWRLRQQTEATAADGDPPPAPSP